MEAKILRAFIVCIDTSGSEYGYPEDCLLNDGSNNHCQHGFALAGPSFSSLVANQRAKNVASDLFGSLLIARSEAITSPRQRRPCHKKRRLGKLRW